MRDLCEDFYLFYEIHKSVQKYLSDDLISSTNKFLAIHMLDFLNLFLQWNANNVQKIISCGFFSIINFMKSVIFYIFMKFIFEHFVKFLENIFHLFQDLVLFLISYFLLMCILLSATFSSILLAPLVQTVPQMPNG